MATARVTDGEWFADVPTAGTERLRRAAAVAVRELDERDDDAARQRASVLLHGVPLCADGADATIVSCGGLLARVPRRPSHASGSAAVTLAVVERA
jgi:hypothetical protein